MTTNDTTSLDRQEAEVARWVNSAQVEGRPDAYQGKRDHIRYILGASLQLSTDPNDDSAKWTGTMHNVSGGGIGVWSKKKVEAGSTIFIRDASRSVFAPWISAKVKHVSVGLRGYLIGAAFTQPASTEEPHVADHSVNGSLDQDPRPAAIPKPAAPAHPLWRRIALASAATSTTVLCITLGMNKYIAAYGLSVWFVVAVIAVIYCVGSLMAWGILRPDLLFLRDFVEHLTQVPREEFQNRMIRPAPSKELENLRLAFVDLTGILQQREDHQRIHRQKLEELASVKTNILSIVSHDLRTPLTSILLYAKMLQDDLETLTDEDQRHFLGVISDECNRLSRLVDDLLEVQGLEAGRVQWHMEAQDLAKTTRSCARVFEAMAKSKSIEFSVDCPESLPSVEADADKISQVLSNLISNALKYTPSGGQVRLVAREEGNRILFCIGDNGPGIPRDQWDQIFDRFTQLSDPNVRKISGVGLGLYIVKKIVERHHGIVWVDSEMGQGSQFYVSLPMKVDKSTPSEVEASPASERVLICDADPELTATMAMILQSHNFEVSTVHTGCRLLARLARGDIDVVVTDVLLPDMNAMEVLESLTAAEDRSYRTVLHSYAGEVTDVRHKGVDVFLHRPASKEELVQAVRVAAQRRSISGKTVMLVADEVAKMDGLMQLLADKGHFPICARTPGEAHRLLHHYPIDVAVFTEDALEKDWIGLEKVGISSAQGLPVFVLCERLRKKERRLAQAHGITALTYAPGDEEAIARTVVAAQEVLVPEVSQ